MMTGFYNYFGNFFGCSDESIPTYRGQSLEPLLAKVYLHNLSLSHYVVLYILKQRRI